MLRRSPRFFDPLLDAAIAPNAACGFHGPTPLLMTVLNVDGQMKLDQPINGVHDDRRALPLVRSDIVQRNHNGVLRVNYVIRANHAA